MKFKFLSTIIASLVLLTSSFAHATLIFSNVSYTNDSVTFTVDGDLTGYDLTGLNTTAFSLQYIGDIWAGLTSSSSNRYSGNVFDGIGYDSLSEGSTGRFSSFGNTLPYTWFGFSSSYNNSTKATNNTVTVRFRNNFLDSNAETGTINFLLGNANNGSTSPFGASVLVGSFDIAQEVSEPSILAIFALGMIGLASRRFRTRK